MKTIAVLDYFMNKNLNIIYDHVYTTNINRGKKINKMSIK